MGVSTDATLFYGVEILDVDAEDGQEKFKISEEDYIDDWEWSEYFADCLDGSETGVQCDAHAHINHPVFYVYLEQYLSRRGYSTKIPQLENTEAMKKKILEACKDLGIEVDENAIGWYLAPYTDY